MLSLALRFVIYVSRVSCLSAPKGRVVPASRATGRSIQQVLADAGVAGTKFRRLGAAAAGEVRTHPEHSLHVPRGIHNSKLRLEIDRTRLQWRVDPHTRSPGRKVCGGCGARRRQPA